MPMKIPFHFSSRYGRVILLVALIALTVVALLCGIHYWEYRRGEVENESPVSTEQESGVSQIIVEGQPYAVNDEIESVLFIGVDKFEDESWGSYVNNQQADVVLLAVFNHQDKTYSMIPINRDTMVKIKTLGVTGESGGTITAQLALSHAYGTGHNDSARNVLHSVSDLFYGVKIDHYVSLKMDGVPILNDAVGGVEVELLGDFTALDPSYIEGATVVLHGDDALYYIRARYGMEDPTNESRMERQKQYMSAWQDAYNSAVEKDEITTTSMLTEVSDYLTTDIPVSSMEDFAGYMDTYTFNGFQEIVGESVKGDEHMEFHVDESALQKQVLSLFYVPINE